MEKLVFTAVEMARALAITDARALELLRSGEIPAYREGKNWKIPKTLLLKYVEDKAIAEAKERRTN